MGTEASFGELLRYWRKARRVSQLDLSLDAGVSTRHLSFLETGRSHPSREMVLLLGEVLDVPLRDRNRLLEAAGFASHYRDGGADGAALASVRKSLRAVLGRLGPYPATLVDRHWNVLEQNEAAGAVLLHFLAEPAALELPLNGMRLLFRPEGARPFLLNWAEVASAMIQRLHREAAAAPNDDVTRALLDECLASAAIPRGWRLPDGDRSPDVVVPLALKRGDLELRLFTTLTTVGTPLDASLAELRLETFLPVDDGSDATLRRLVASPS